MSGGQIDLRDLLALAAIPGVGAWRARALVSHFGTPGVALEAAPPELVKVPGIERKIASAIAHHLIPEEFLDDQFSRLNKVNGTIVTIWDAGYPENLRRIYDPPAFLFCRGTLSSSDTYALAIVGTRHPTPYGSGVTERFGRELAGKGITIVSGLARGVDTIAHTSALRAGGRTIAVIGSAIDIIYPPENLPLVQRMEEEGAIVSEFFMGTGPDARNFPRRNRIISGIALGTVIVETAENGGAMITAQTTLDQDRELFCVPGCITEKYAAGTNRLIRDSHAKLVTCADDVLAELRTPLQPILGSVKAPPLPELTVFEQKILDSLTSDAMHVDLLSERTGLSISDTLVNLLGLEFKGMVRQLPGKLFVRL